MMRLFLSVFVILASCLPVFAADKVTILTEDFPPFGYLVDDQLRGIGPEIVQKMMAINHMDAGDIEVLPWKRAYRLAQSQANVGLFSMSRIAQRETDFKWVGPLYSMQSYLFARSDFQGDIQTLKDAQTAGPILVQAGGSSEQELRSLGFTNLVPVPESTRQVEMLLLGRANLLFTTDATILYQLKKNHHQVSEIKPMVRIRSSEFYLAFSKSTPDETVANWQAALETLKKSGALQTIQSKYQVEGF